MQTGHNINTTLIPIYYFIILSCWCVYWHGISRCIWRVISICWLLDMAL